MNVRRAATIVCIIAAGVLVIAWRIHTTAAANKHAVANSQSNVRTIPAAIDQRPTLAFSGKTVELCGYGQIYVEPSGDIYPTQVRAAATKTIGRVLGAYVTDPDPSTRAIGLHVQALTQGLAAADLYRSTHVRCEQDSACMQQAHTARIQVMRPTADKLASEVAAMRAPQAYALSLYLCQQAYPGGAKVGPCTQVTPAQWAVLEPDNVIPWLAEASLALSRGDDFARDTALRQTAAAKTSRLHWETILAIAAHPIFIQAQPATRLAALIELLDIHAALPTPALHVIDQQCGDMVRMNDDRQRLCSGIATTLTAGTTLFELSIAARIGEHAGWSSDRTNVLRDKADAIRQATNDSWDSNDLWSCKHLGKVEAHAFALFRYGEVGAGERALEKADYPAADLARQWRQQIRMRETSAEGTRN